MEHKIRERINGLVCPCVRVCLYQAQDPGALEQLSKNISRVGLTNLTLNYLRVCYNHI